MSENSSVEDSAGRIQLVSEPDFKLGDILVRPSAREVVLTQGRELLEPRVMQVLTALAKARGMVLSRDDLIESCWEGRIVGEDSIHRCIVRLRKLAEASGGVFTIETVPRIGYRLIQSPAAGPMSARGSARRWGLQACVIVVLLAAGLVTWRLWPAPPPGLRVAVLPFESAAGDPVARALAAGLPDAVVASLTERQTPTVSRAVAGQAGHGGARLLVSGAVARSGANLTVRLRVDDARTGLTVWSASMERPTGESEALRDQAAARLADNIDRARRAFGSRREQFDGPTLAAYLQVMDGVRLGSSHSAEVLQAERDLVARAPSFSPAHSNLACDLALALRNQPPAIAANWGAEAAGEARRALALDPNNGEAYVALYFLEPERARARREALLLEGLARDPRNATLLNFEAKLLQGSGRTAAALLMFQQALMLDQLSAPKTGDTLRALAAAGRTAESSALGARGSRLWPENPILRASVLSSALLYAPPARALEALDAYQTGVPRLDPAMEGAWRAYVEDRRLGRKNPATARALVGAAPATWNESASVVGAVAQMGEVDDAFSLADRLARVDPRRVEIAALFEPGASVLRRDPRFMRLVARLGLVDYWRTTGRWPDFCSEPGIAYDCRIEAARLGS